MRKRYSFLSKQIRIDLWHEIVQYIDRSTLICWHTRRM